MAGPETKIDNSKEAPKGDKKADVKDPAKFEDAGHNLVASAFTSCDAMSCKVEIKEEPWQREVNQILDEVSSDPSLKVAFNTFLQEYVKSFGKENAFEVTADTHSNFYGAIDLVGVPDSALGFNTAMNDILHFAAKGVKDSTAKWPYEKLKAVVDKVRGGNKGTELAQK